MMVTAVETTLDDGPVRDAAEAFKKLKSTGADLILTDWRMEPLDGLDFVRLVRKARDTPNPYIPIITVTGHTETSRVKEARDAGVTERRASGGEAVAEEGVHRMLLFVDWGVPR